ncbi:hypothetical protein JW872_00630 [Candidatus Babeliales bacterium]|nr:hypothetical protein [Candidatus Babeliales bacterium]
MFLTKKRLFFAWFSLCLLTSTQPMLPDSNAAFEDDFFGPNREIEGDPFELEDPFADYLGNLDEEDLGVGPLRSNPNPAYILIPVMNECGMVEIFKHSLFCHTYPLNERNILDNPIFYTPLSDKKSMTLKGHFFYNHTRKNYFTEQNNGIGSYLAINHSTFTQALQNSFNRTLEIETCRDFFTNTIGIEEEYFETDIQQKFALLKNIRVEDRRVGVMFELLAPFNNLNYVTQLIFNLKIPFLYRERNVTASSKDITRLKDDISEFFPQTTETPDASLMEVIKNPFVREYAIRDKIGFGDSRLSIGYKVADTEKYQFALGPEFTFPTAITLQHNVWSTARKIPPKRPTFDLSEFFQRADANPEVALVRELKDIGTSAIERLDDMLLNTGLGNGGHFGLGIFIEPTVHFNKDTHWYNRLAFEALLPGTHRRYFLKKVDISEFDGRDFASDDETIADDNMSFLNQRLLDMVFPNDFLVRVTPGAQLKITSIVDHVHGNWKFKLGTDYWLQGRESFRFIDMNSTGIANYEIERGRRPSAKQLKFLGGFAYDTTVGNATTRLFLNAETTAFSSGIGKDFTVAGGLVVTW